MALWRSGAAIGDLGRHTEVMLVQNMEGEVAPMPILTHRTVVFQQVGQPCLQRSGGRLANNRIRQYTPRA